MVGWERQVRRPPTAAREGWGNQLVGDLETCDFRHGFASQPDATNNSRRDKYRERHSQPMCLIGCCVPHVYMCTCFAHKESILALRPEIVRSPGRTGQTRLSVGSLISCPSLYPTGPHFCFPSPLCEGKDLQKSSMIEPTRGRSIQSLGTFLLGSGIAGCMWSAVLTGPCKRGIVCRSELIDVARTIQIMS